MGSNYIIVREYLESLKEDSELDYLFPILLNLMGFRIKATPKNSKGQSQYGKDVVAVGVNDQGTKSRYYFELKGYSDKDIDDRTFSKADGIRDSIIASKYTPYQDSTDPEFNSLPIEVVVVHNGILKANTRDTFNGFIAQEFPNGGFDRWDIFRLTDLFSQYLFGEYLLTDDESIRLFKRTLVLLDAPENDFSDFKQLVDLQISRTTKVEGRALKKFFATLDLLSIVILHYSQENNNLYPARQCLSYLVLRLWAWILRNKLEKRQAILNGFRKILRTHFNMLNLYFIKTLPIAEMEDGLYVEHGGFYEAVGYPLRSLDYLNYFTYYCEARLYFPKFNSSLPNSKQIRLLNLQKAHLMTLVRNNDACSRPLVDNHSIAILNLVTYFLKNPALTQEEFQFTGEYIASVLENILVIKAKRKRFPELSSNVKTLVEFVATGERPEQYEDRSTLLITILFELLVVMDMEIIYNSFYKGFKGKVNLQVALAKFDEHDIEQLLFEQKFHDEFAVEASIDLPDTFSQFKANVIAKPRTGITYRTDAAGFPFLRRLAHIYYGTEFFVDEWRSLLTLAGIEQESKEQSN